MNRRLGLLFRLLLFQKVNDKVLILPDEVVRQALRLQIVAKMVSPLRVEGFQGSELGGWLISVHAVADAS